MRLSQGSRRMTEQKSQSSALGRDCGVRALWGGHSEILSAFLSIQLPTHSPLIKRSEGRGTPILESYLFTHSL